MHSTSSTLVLVLAVFGASLVEMVEALTLVVAAGVSRGWRSALEGAVVAAVVLGVLVVVVGVPLVRYVPIDALRVVVGALLLVLGLSWLRKAILRGSGHLGLHDEAAALDKLPHLPGGPRPQAATLKATGTDSPRAGACTPLAPLLRRRPADLAATVPARHSAPISAISASSRQAGVREVWRGRVCPGRASGVRS